MAEGFAGGRGLGIDLGCRLKLRLSEAARLCFKRWQSLCQVPNGYSRLGPPVTERRAANPKRRKYG